MKLLYPHLAIIYFDIKIADPDLHKKYCGVSNEKIMDNFVILHNHFRRGGVTLYPRTPLIPGITDTEENITQIAQFYKKHNVEKASLLSYNPLWHEKNSQIGIHNKLSDDKKMSTWMDNSDEERCKKIFNDFNIEC